MPITYAFFVPHPPIIVSEVGKGQEKIVQKTIDAYHKIGKKISEIKPDTIIISSPHSTVYSDYFHISPGKNASGNLGQFGAKSVSYSVDYDCDLRDKIVHEIENSNLPGGTFGERYSGLDHGSILPIYFINKYYDNYELIKLSPSGLSLIDHYEFGMMVNSLIEPNKNIVWVASGDLSHKLKADGPYGIVKEGKEFDDIFTESIKTKDILKILKLDPDFYHKAAECGLGSFCMMAGVFDGFDIDTELLSYEGTFGVGYAIASFKRLNPNKEREFKRIYRDDTLNELNEIKKHEDPYVKLARASLEFYIKNKKRMPFPKNLDSDLISRKAGVFVSLHKGGRLRGCIGTIYPATSSVAEEIIDNAISAGTRDYRFSSVKINELDSLEYSVDVLGEPEPIIDESDLDILKYGVIVRHNHKTGLLLPNIEGINSINEQIQIAKRKAGISDTEEFTLERFEVIRHH